MNLFDYIPDLGEHGSLREKPNIEIPYCSKYHNRHACFYCYQFYKHLSSLPTYPCTKELKEWIEKNPKEGYEWGVDFEIDGTDRWMMTWVVGRPVEMEKEESEDELWDEAAKIINPSGWVPFKKLNSLKQQFTIKRKP